MSEAAAGEFAISRQFWAGKRVFVTGHTGFKGSWLLVWLSELGAHVGGYALAPDTTPSMFHGLDLRSLCEHVVGDIRNEAALQEALRKFQPEVAIHLAAQPIVRRSYEQPLETFHTNAQVLDACRHVEGLRSVVVVTTDKVYENREWLWAYREVDRLGGHDPYSASKACAELIAAAYRNSFFASGVTALATARAGNVFGGGDWAADRLIPDAARAFAAGRALVVRNPSSTRPWQHVTESLAGYLMLARALYERGREYAAAFNFGPRADQRVSVRETADLFCRYWGAGARWVHHRQPSEPHEAGMLLLDSSLARARLGWSPSTTLDNALKNTAEWYRAFYANAGPREMLAITRRQLAQFGEERRGVEEAADESGSPGCVS
jgi:CDP-glucose 4,6-dehydratase